MLEIVLPEREMFNEETNEFVTIKQQTLQLEHSLLSLSKWESKWKKPFLGNEEHTREETLDYIRCMTINQHVDPIVYEYIPFDSYMKIKDYISDSQTATTIYDRRPHRGGARETITSELIYYWMIYFGIPFECQKWHLNRLLTLIRVCGVKGTNETMSKNAVLEQNRMLNAMRRGSGKG